MDAVIFDVDGTLADVRGIRHYVTPPHRDFDSFHRASSFVRPHAAVAALASQVRHAGVAVLVVTARQDCYRSITSGWLDKHAIDADELFMRRTGDSRPDVEVKRDILAAIRRRGYRVVAAVDDNPSVLALWRGEGIPVVVVPGWDGDVDGDVSLTVDADAAAVLGSLP